MNFIIRNLLLFTVLLCTVACSLDENFDRSSWKNIDFRVSVSGQSRVAIQKDGSGDFQAGDEVALRVYGAQLDSFRIKRCYFAKENGGLLPYIGKTGRKLLIFMQPGLLLLRLSCGREPACASGESEPVGREGFFIF